MADNQKNSSRSLVDSVFKLTDKERRLMYSPARLVITIALSVFVSETVIMSIIEYFYRTLEHQDILLDATLLTLFISLLLYFLLFRPLMHLVNDCRINEAELKLHKEALEQKVRERTAELEIANDRLKKENEEYLKATRALNESEERFYRIFQESEDAIVLVTVDDQSILDVNPASERIFGLDRDSILRGGVPALCDADTCEVLKSAIDHIITSGDPNNIELYRCRKINGEICCLSLRGKIINIHGKNVVYITFRDITTRIRLEEESRSIQSRLIQANRMTSLGTMISSVAHELNNPNNFLLMNSRIIASAWEDILPVLEAHYRANGDFEIANLSWQEARQSIPEAVEGIQQGSARISGIIGNLKSISRNEGVIQNPLADVNSVVRLSVSILNYLIADSTDNFKLELAEELPPVRGHERQLEQVVINLIQNALQALPDKSHCVKVSTHLDTDSEHVLIRVSDDGNGLHADIADRIMEPFFTTRLEQGGTGLGLAICSAIVKEFDGSIDYYSAGSGLGTIFTVRLCRADNISTSSEAVDEN